MSNQETPCRDSFVFYRSFYESIKRLPERAQNALFRAVAEYGLDQVVPDFAGIPQQPFVEAIFAGIRPQLDANHKRFLNGCKGGAPVGNRNNPNGRKGGTNQEPTKNQPNDNVNENGNVNENVQAPRPMADQDLTLPFHDQEFVKTWNELRQQPKWRKKTSTALQKSLNQLGKFHSGFAVQLMEISIANEYQGVVFSDTPARYQQWLKVTPVEVRGKGPISVPGTSAGRMIATGENPYKD